MLLPFTERQLYSSPYPVGLAVGHVDMLGDASGGNVVCSFLVDGGFLFRAELFNWAADEATVREGSFITSHRMLTDRSGLGATAFDLNWIRLGNGDGGFVVYQPRVDDFARIRRIPMGRTDDVQLQTLCAFFINTNVDTIVYDFDVIFSYWDVRSLIEPGFLQSFWEAPIVERALIAP